METQDADFQPGKQAAGSGSSLEGPQPCLNSPFQLARPPRFPPPSQVRQQQQQPHFQTPASNANLFQFNPIMPSAALVTPTTTSRQAGALEPPQRVDGNSPKRKLFDEEPRSGLLTSSIWLVQVCGDADTVRLFC